MCSSDLFTSEDFALLHPAGQLGKRLLKVEQLMHEGDALPRVEAAASMREAIYEMSKKGLGITAVTDVAGEAGRLVGCISATLPRPPWWSGAVGRKCGWALRHGVTRLPFQPNG